MFIFTTNGYSCGLTFTVQCEPDKMSAVSKPTAVLLAPDLGDQTVL